MHTCIHAYTHRYMHTYMHTCIPLWQVLAASKAVLREPQPQARINVAGHHFLLSQLIAHCKHPQIPDGPDTDLSSKCVCSDRLLGSVMPPGYRFVEPLASV